VAVTVAGKEKAAWCRALGADQVIDYKQQHTGHALHEFAPKGVDVYFDTTRKFDAKTALESLAQRGRIVLIAGTSH
jgi:NADPH:quinone reductase